MRTCPYCKISVGGEGTKCPLCQNRLSGEASPSNWPSSNSLKKGSVLYKLQLFLVLSFGIIMLFVDYVFEQNFRNHWSLLVAMWLIAFEFGIVRLFKQNYSPSRVVTLFGLIVSGMLVVTGYYTGTAVLIGGLVVPMIIMATMIVNFILLMVDKGSNSMVYLLGNILIGAIPYLIIFWLGKTVPIAWILCLLISVVTFLGACIFRGRAVLGELQRRFHV